MITPIKKRGLPPLSAAKSKIGVPINAATNPIPWLILFANSSLGDCVHFGKTDSSSTAFIA
jgi:hypothetical protein